MTSESIRLSNRRHPLFSAIALCMALAPSAVIAGNLSGPGSSATVNPGDTPESWFLSDGAALTIAPGGATGFIQSDNSRVTGNDVAIGGFIGIRLQNNSTGDITGGTITITTSMGDAGAATGGSTLNLSNMAVNSAGRGLQVADAGSQLSIRNTTIASGGEALSVLDGGSLVLDGVSARSDGSASGANGYGLSMSGGVARISNSTLSGRDRAISMFSTGDLFIERSTIEGLVFLQGDRANPGTPPPVATVVNSELAGSTAVALLDGAAFTAVGSSIRGTGTGRGLSAVSVSGGTFRALDASVIEGATTGISISSGQVELDRSRVVSGSGPAMSVGGGGGSITLRNGASVEGGNGIALEVAALGRADLSAAASTIQGDIVGKVQGINTAEVNVALSDRASLTGAIINGSNVTVDGAHWRLTGDSNVQQFGMAGNALVELGDGAGFHTLQVAGDYTSDGGTLVFNTVLAGDDAATDKLVIGGDSSGQTNVRVNNVGGAGAQTNQGIELIQVAGASNGQFDLAGRAVGGQYEYFLFKGTGTDGNWYLRSQLPGQPDPCDVDPTLPDCTPVNPEPVLRPEPGAYLANLQAAQTLFRIGYHDRNAGQNAGRAWARVDGARNGFDAVSQQLDIRGNSQALTVGADVWRADTGSSAGVMISSGNASSTSTNPLTGYHARGKVKGEALGIYATWRSRSAADPYAGFYVDGSLQRAQFRNRVEGSGLSPEHYDSRAWQGAIEAGYAFPLGGARNGGLFLEPQLQVGYNRWDALRHTEANGTVVTAQDADGLFGRVGLRLSGVTRWGGAAAEVQPYIAANWLHTRAESQVRMDDEVVDARIPRSRAEVSAGASVKFANGMGAWGGISRQQSSGYHLTSAQLGMSYSW